MPARLGNTVIPAEGTPSGERLDASLDGEWSLTGDTVAFDFDADLFLEEMTFRVTGLDQNPVFAMDGTGTFDETRVEMTLSPD